jgi:hypothetical protein
VDLADAGTYSVAVTNAAGSATSQPAMLTVRGNDLDQDGLPDDWERLFDLDPSEPTGENGPDGDPDHDGRTNLEELLAGTAPNDPASVLRILSTALASDGESVVLSFLAISNRTYTVQASDTLPATRWTRIRNVPAPTVTGVVTVTNVPASPSFLRVVTPAQP